LATSNTKVQDDKMWGFLGFFLTILGFVIVMLAKKESHYAMHYAKQGLVMGILYVVATFLKYIPFIGSWYIRGLISLGLFILWIIGVVYSLSGEEKDVPLVGQLAKKINL